MPHFIIDPYRFAGPACDPYWSSVAFLTHFDVEVSAHTFRNLGPSGAGDLTNANSSRSSVQSVFGGFSARVPPTNNYLTTPSSRAEYLIGTADFTIEFAVWLDTLPSHADLINLWNGGSATTAAPAVWVNSSGVLRYATITPGPTYTDRITSASGVIGTSGWYRIALSRSGGNSRLFVDGGQVGSTFADSTNFASAGGNPIVTLGADGFNNANTINGAYYDEFRFTNGVGRYSGNYSLATEAFPEVAC